ncbi:MAG: hypothetical protein K9G44_05735 [Melioribacteraceae bacterium]|nr:hypothetical protein [Melioribacteraceae bacterium]
MILIIISLVVLLIGESGAFAIGMNLKINESSIWRNKKNFSLLITDILFGLLLIYSEYFIKNNYLPLIFLSLLLISTHLFRQIEYYTNKKRPFIFNKGMLIVNGVKLFLSFSLLFLLLS